MLYPHLVSLACLVCAAPSVLGGCASPPPPAPEDACSQAYRARREALEGLYAEAGRPAPRLPEARAWGERCRQLPELAQRCLDPSTHAALSDSCAEPLRTESAQLLLNAWRSDP